MTEMRAEELRPSHLGQTVEVPVGLDMHSLHLGAISFRRYEKSLRVVVEDGRGAYYTLPAYAKVRLL